jgi:hypothetical protein
MDMPLDRDLFRLQFERFEERVRGASGRRFTSFKEGIPAEWEGYKEHLRQKALGQLNVNSMSEAQIGDGAILERLIECIEISAAPDTEANNLVRWENRYGHASRSHRALLDARQNPTAVRTIESWAVGFFRGAIPPADAFEQFREIVGSRYDLIAYLFFLRDWNSYMPIAPITFDKAFSLLGIDLVARQQCSWGNYQRYTSALQDIRAALVETTDISDLRLIDAHSFCWLLVRPELDRIDPAISARPKTKVSVKIYDARGKSIVEMAYNAVNTARNANGQQVTVTKKEKELELSQSELETYIDRLLMKQEEKCALTGITLQYRGEDTDRQLLASLDRIDSEGHYTEGNLQVVCRFVNKWKSDLANAEFIRLLSLVRQDEL